MEPERLSFKAIQKHVSSPMSRTRLVDFSSKSVLNGRNKFRVIQATKDIDNHIGLMKNRIKRLKSEEEYSKKAMESSVKKEKFLDKIREGHRAYQAQIKASKPKEIDEIEKKKQQVKEKKEKHRQKMKEAEKRMKEKKEERRKKVRAESLDNKKIIENINKAISNRKKEKATTIRNHETCMKESRVQYAKNMSGILRQSFLGKCEEELRTAQVSKNRLLNLTLREENLADSLKNTSELSFYKHISSDNGNTLSTQLIKFD